MNDLDDEWLHFVSNNFQAAEQNLPEPNKLNVEDVIPIPSNIYISTKSKIAFLNMPIDLDIFWKLDVIPYYFPKEGIIKKQIKVNSKSIEELNTIQERLKLIPFHDVHIINQVHNPSARSKFKDTRKISIGICKKDLLSYRCKKKQAFYNCFVLILRLNVDSLFKEFHVKVFNTGKLEIPGVQNDNIFNIILNKIQELFQPFFDQPIEFGENSDTVLINSNFNCGFFINREVLFELLTQKYGLHAIYDPCSYPGVQCKFYYDSLTTTQTGIMNSTISKTKGISFMVFRTGSVLIVGMCEEDVLFDIYDFLKELLIREYHLINQPQIEPKDIIKEKKKKIRKKDIYLSSK